MLTRRLVALGAPVLLLPSRALAVRALSEGERRALWDIQAQSTQEASRLTGLAADYSALANTHRAGDVELAGKLTAMDGALRRGVRSLNAALAALPASARAPTSSLQAPAPVGQSRLPTRVGVPESRVTITPATPTLEALVAETRFAMRIWGRVGEALRAIDAETGAGLVRAAAHYERAKTNLEAANVALRRISALAAIRNDLLDSPQDSEGRLGSFEIQDAASRASQAETLAARTRNALGDAASTLLREVH